MPGYPQFGARKKTMTLTPSNSTNPILWGWEVDYLNGKMVFRLKIDFPKEVDFVQALFPNDPIGARKYFKA